MVNKRLLRIALLAMILIQLCVSFSGIHISRHFQKISYWITFRNANWNKLTAKEVTVMEEHEQSLMGIFAFIYFFAIFTLPLILIRWTSFKVRIITSGVCSVILALCYWWSLGIPAD